MLVRFLRYTSGFLLLVLVVAVVLLLTLDFGRFKGHAEVFVSDLLNRDLSIAGPVHLTVGRSIKFSAVNASLASTDWSNAQSLVSFKQLEINVNTWSLIRGPILLESIVLDGLRVNLEQNESGENNWTLIEAMAQEPNQVIPPPIEGAQNSPGLSILPIHINITDSLLSYQNPDIEQEIVLVIDKAQQVIDELYDLQFIVDGNINQIPINLNATASTENHSIDYSDIDFNLSAAVGNLQIEAIAVIDDLLKPSRPTVSAHINAPNIERLAETLGLQPFATGLFKMDLELQPVGQKMKLDLAAILGEFEVVANGEFAELQEFDDIELQLNAGGPDIGDFNQLLGLPGIIDGPFDIEAKIIPEQGGSRSILLKADAGDIGLKIDGSINEDQSLSGQKANIRFQAASFNRIA
ncbi:MAG: AsmA family protein, partial [Psychromonas sp.]